MSDELLVGAERIATVAFDGAVSPDQVYRMAREGWPIIRVRGKLAARPAAIRKHIEDLEREALALGRKSEAA